MLKAICDECGREIELRYYDHGFENPPGWQVTTLSSPLIRHDLMYRVFCPDCNSNLVRKVEE